MKKLICLLLSILACLTIVACEDKQEQNPQIPSQSEETENEETENEVPENPEQEEDDGGNVVTPIRPGGNFNGGGY